MQKSIFQDMVKINQDRRPSLEGVARKPVKSTLERKREPEPVKYERVYERTEEWDTTPRKSRNTLWMVAVVAVIFFLFALSYLFSSAEITIDPKIKDFTLSQNLSASLNGGEDVLSFDSISISGEDSVTVPATEKKDVVESARGAVIIYNKFSTTSQRLDINTRLEGSNGKIYKTEKAIVVPGMVGTTPGSVEVMVYGAGGGETYNSEPLDFKIFGFKGTPKYEKFYGRSKGNLSGGFIGNSFVASAEDKAKALENLKVSLKDKLFKKAASQIPQGFVLLNDAVVLNLDDTQNDSLLSKNNTLTITQKGTLVGIFFKEEELTKKIAKNVIDKYDDSDVYIANIKDLIFSMSNTTTPLKDLKNIDFNLSGTAKMVWRMDAEKLRGALLGKSKKDFNQILLGYPYVTSANLSLSPIWNRTIPDKAKSVKIVINYPE
jgi:predicted Zn-dependent protease with MMP-like domain